MRLAMAVMVVGVIVLPALAADDVPATRPATQPASRAVPLSTPLGAVEFLFELLAREDFVTIRNMTLTPVTVSEVRTQLEAVQAVLRDGGTHKVVDSNTVGPVAVALLRLTESSTGREFTAPIILIQRYDEWKVELGTLNMRRLTERERDSFQRLAEWSNSRLEQLRVTSTQPATRSAQ